ncbi:hypothetical protein D3C78_1692050 [compost metagenome]
MGIVPGGQRLGQPGLHLGGERTATAHLVLGIFVEQPDQGLAMLPVAEVCPDDLFHVSIPCEPDDAHPSVKPRW